MPNTTPIKSLCNFKPVIYVVAVFLALHGGAARAALYDWTRMQGSNIVNKNGTYGTPAATIDRRSSSWDINGDWRINALDYDDDEDGFPNNIELMMGTNINDALDTPTGLPGPIFINALTGKLIIKGKINKKTGEDTLSFKVSLRTTSTESLAGKVVAVDVGGNLLPFTMDTKKGTKGVAPGGLKMSCKFKPSKTGGPTVVELSFKLKGMFRPVMVLNEPVDSNGNPTQFSVNLFLLGSLYVALQEVQFK